MKLSKRVVDMQFSPIRKLMPIANEIKKGGIKVYPLNIGQPDINTPKEFFEGINKYNENIVTYSDSQGIHSLSKSFVTYYEKHNINLNEEDILITYGGSESILFAIMAICDSGDEIIIPEPFYTNYSGFAKMCGVTIVPVTCKAEDGFHLPAKEVIAKKISSKTKGILFSNPCNPTGVVYNYNELRELCDIAKEHDLFIISDEVYREFIYDGTAFTSMLNMTDMLDRIILVDSISKRYSACGARIGMLVSKNRTFIEQATKFCQSRLCAPTIEQIAASNLINTPAEYFQKVTDTYSKRRDILYNALKEIPGVICHKPNGAFYIMATLPIVSSEHFARWMLQHYSFNDSTVLVAPAEDFYITKGLGKNEIRLSYCINSTDLKKAAEILKNGLYQYKKYMDRE